MLAAVNLLLVTKYKCAMKDDIKLAVIVQDNQLATGWWLRLGWIPDSPWTVLMQWTPEVPFLPLTTRSVAERNMYLVPAIVTPFMASSSVLAYRVSKVLSSSAETCNGNGGHCSTVQCWLATPHCISWTTTVRAIDNLHGGINRDKVVLVINHCCLLQLLHYFAS